MHSSEIEGAILLKNTHPLRATCGSEGGSYLLPTTESEVINSCQETARLSAAAGRRACSRGDPSQLNYTKVYFQDEFLTSSIFGKKLFSCFLWKK